MSIHKRTTARGVRYDVRLRDPEGRPYKRTFTAKKDAERFERSELVDRARGAWIDPSRAERPFSQVADEWLPANPAKRSSTMARDESIVRTHLVPALADPARRRSGLGARPIGSITVADVQRLVQEWSQSQAPRTVRRQYGVLRAVLAYAVELELITKSPCRGVRLPAVEPVGCHVVTAEELVRLADAMGRAYGPMAYLGAMLGLRWAEVAGIRVGRLDFLRGTLYVGEQLTRGEGGRSVAGPPKSHAGRRTLAVPASVMALSAGQLARAGLTGAEIDAYVFTAPDGGPLRYSNWRRRVWLPACSAVGLEGLQFHDLRRANATGLVDAGVDLKTAQVRLGHSDPRLTLAVYAQASTEADRAAAGALEARFGCPANGGGCAIEVPSLAGS